MSYFRWWSGVVGVAATCVFSSCGGSATMEGGDAGPRTDAGPHADAGVRGDAGPIDAWLPDPTTRLVDGEMGLDTALVTRAAMMVPGAANDASLAPTIVYPYDQTIVPPNLYLIEWQWNTVRDADLYVTTFRGRSVLATFVSSRNTFILPSATWRMLAQSSYTSGIDVTVYAVRRSDLARAGRASIHIGLGPSDLRGGLYYFTTNEDDSRQGIFRYDFGTPVASATRFLSQSVAGGCVGCHALSRDGSKMGLTFEGGFGYMAAIQTATPASYTFGSPRGPQRGAFVQYFDSDRSMLAIYDKYDDDPRDPLNGKIRVYDAASGMPDDTRNVPIGASARASHLGVAPDGRTVVYVDYADTDHRPIHEERGSLKIVTYDPGTRSWSTPRTLLAYDGRLNNYYPAFSPDSEWIIFNRAPGDAYDNAQASIWVIRADGSGGPIELVAANHAMRLTNSWPRWAPFVQRDEFGVARMWFAFSSKRDYGVKLRDAGRAQLWMASFSPAAALGGGDPSAPAFWLPFQAIETQNHTPEWTERIADRECNVDDDCLDPMLRCDPAMHQCVLRDDVEVF